MVVRIRFGKGSKLGRKRQKNRRVALVLAVLLPPSALAAGVLAFWRIAADLNWTSSFAITSGIFSHWQVWLALSVAIHMLATFLNRFGRPDDSVLS